MFARSFVRARKLTDLPKEISILQVAISFHQVAISAPQPLQRRYNAGQNHNKYVSVTSSPLQPMQTLQSYDLLGFPSDKSVPSPSNKTAFFLPKSSSSFVNTTTFSLSQIYMCMLMFHCLSSTFVK